MLGVSHVQKVRFAQQSVGREPLERIVGDHVFQHVVGGPERLVHGVQTNTADPGAGGGTVVLLVKDFRAALFKIGHRPDVRASQDPVDFVHLVVFVLAAEQRPAGGHFVEHATRGPDIHFRVVPVGRQQAFRRPVPEFRQVRRIRLARRHVARGPEIADFQRFVLEQYVFRVDVSVDEAVLVYVFQTFTKLQNRP